MNKKISLILDSGAPSLYNFLIKVNKSNGVVGSHLADRKYDDYSFLKTQEYLEYRDNYIFFITKNQDIFIDYANLDIVNNAEETWKNQKYLESKGLSPIPVFHFGCDLKWLKKYIDEGYQYIAIGGMVPNPSSILFPQLDYIWKNLLTDKDGFPLVKVHGFALTSFKLMLRWPWYSVDSTSWVMFSKYGTVLVPLFDSNTNCYLYGSKCHKIFVSSRSPKLKTLGKHIDTFSQYEKEKILEYFEMKGYRLGRSEFFQTSSDYTLSENEKWGDRKNKIVERIVDRGLCNDHRLRDEINAIFYRDFEKSLPPWPWPFKIKHTSVKFFQ